MSNSPVRYQLQDNLGTIYIDNPPVNAISHAVRAGLMNALGQARNDTSQALLILCKGQTFIAGADVAEFGKPPLEPHLPAVIKAIEDFPIPVVAALHGNTLGGGLEIALAAHYRCAQPGTRLGLPEVKLGLIPGSGGTQRLPRLIGAEAALDMIISGSPITAEVALAKGLVDTLLTGELECAAIAYAQQLLSEKASVRPTGLRPVIAPQEDKYFARYRTRIARKTRGQLSPGYIVDLVELSTQSDLDGGLKLERERFLECRNSAQSAAMRHVFFAERATSKLPDIPAETVSTAVNSVGIIGAGTMGGGIAMCFANAGIPVTLVETKQEFLDRGMAVIAKNYATSVKRGRFSQDEADSFLANLSGTTDYADLADVDVVIEAVFENMDVKKKCSPCLTPRANPTVYSPPTPLTSMWTKLLRVPVGHSKS